MGAPGTTKGTWKVASGSDQFVCSDGKWIASSMGVKGEEGSANVRQMAASGDLYDALVDELADLNEDIRWAEGSDMVRFIARRERMEAAIAKAQGITS